MKAILSRKMAASAAICMLSGLSTATPADQISEGREVFTKTAKPSCTVCHTLADAGSTGRIGPNLDRLQPSAEHVYQAVTNGIGVMPPYRDKLSESERRAVAAYVSSVTGDG